jgi:hypothetical protein
MKKISILLLLSVTSLQSITYSGRPFLSLPTTPPPGSTSVFLFKDHFKPNQPTIKKKNNQSKQKLSDKINEKKKDLRVVAFAGATTNSEDITKYFLPFNQTTLRVREGLAATTNPNVNSGAHDIVAQNFNIANKNDSFVSDLAFKPKQTRAGVSFSGHLQWNDKWWIAFSAPIIHVKNTLDMVETVTFDGNTATTALGFDSSTPSRNMVDAFKAAGMKYGKIDGSQKETRLADITISLGYNFRTEKDYYLQQYFGLSLPTGNKPKAVYLFEPIVGNNKHFTLQMGTLFGMHLGKALHRNWWVKAKAQTTYLAPNTQKRSLDLAGKPWSRYIAIYATEAKRVAETTALIEQTWGINHLTQDVRVSPHFSHIFQIALNSVCTRNYIGTFGYRANIRQAETVELKNSWAQGPQVSNLDGGLAEVNPARGINNMYESFADGTETYFITEDQLDLAGAAHPFSADHTFYLLLSKPYDREKGRIFVEGGINYTFGSNNATPHRWELLFGATGHF